MHLKGTIFSRLMRDLCNLWNTTPRLTRIRIEDRFILQVIDIETRDIEIEKVFEMYPNETNLIFDDRVFCWYESGSTGDDATSFASPERTCPLESRQTAPD